MRCFPRGWKGLQASLSRLAVLLNLVKADLLDLSSSFYLPTSPREENHRVPCTPLVPQRIALKPDPYWRFLDLSHPSKHALRLWFVDRRSFRGSPVLGNSGQLLFRNVAAWPLFRQACCMFRLTKDGLEYVPLFTWHLQNILTHLLLCLLRNMPYLTSRG